MINITFLSEEENAKLLLESFSPERYMSIRLAQLGQTMQDQYGPKICHT